MIGHILHRVRRHTISFAHAFAGLWYVFRTQPNYTVHGLSAVAVIWLGWFVKVSEVEWLILVFTIAMVFTAEMINTAIESVCDLVTHEWHQEAKIAKDVSAAMVLTAAVSSVVVGLVIFTKYLSVFFS